jgi:HD superfamily phosphohydrolase
MAANQKSRSSRPGRDLLSEVSSNQEWQPSVRAERQEFFLPVSGFVWFYPEEVAVIDHPAFQRLAKINQLGQAHLVYRGATHKRIEHALGAVGVVQQMITAVAVNSDKARLRGEADRRASLNRLEERFTRLGALLHDIGHLASGHTLEDELGLFGKHDEDDRLDTILTATDWGTGRTEKRLASVIDHQYGPYLPDEFRRENITPSEILRLLIRKKPKGTNGRYDPSKDKYKKQQDFLSKSSLLRLNVCTNMIGNTLCADLLDYIYRDWYHVGKVMPPEDRIYQYMEVRNPENLALSEEVQEENRRAPTDFFVLALGDNIGPSPKIRTDGVSAILGLLEKRYDLAEAVLYHRAKLAAGAMLGRALYELWSGKDLSALPKNLLPLSDEQLLDFALDRATAATKSNDAIEKANGQSALYLIHRLRARSLYSAFYTVRHWSLAPDQQAALTSRFAPKADDRGLGAKNRALAARMLEQDFELPPGSVVIGCSDVRAKVAEVQIRVNQVIRTFSAYEKTAKDEGKRGLSGGHLNAQVKRFADLWRCDFFIDEEVLADLEQNKPDKLALMRDMIENIFINPPLTAEALDRSAERLARSYVQLEQGRRRNDIEMRARDELHLLAARGDPGVAAARKAVERYPGGARSLSSFWKISGTA